MHPSVQVKSDQRQPLQAEERIHPQRQLLQEGVDHPARALLCREGRPVLADGSGVSRKDCGELGQDCPGPHILRHQPRWPQGPRVEYGGQAGEGRRLVASPCPQGRCLGGTLISRTEPRQKYESGNPQVASKDATPVFPTLPIFLVPRLDPLLFFYGTTVFRQRGTKNAGYDWLSPCYVLVTIKNNKRIKE